MKIWLNNKRVVRDSGYTYCEDCCLAAHFKIRSEYELCFSGYNYETDV